MDDICKYCGGRVVARNPSGTCDHLYWPDNLTDGAKAANGFVASIVTVWAKQEPLGAEAEKAWDDNAAELYRK